MGVRSDTRSLRVQNAVEVVLTLCLNDIKNNNRNNNQTAAIRLQDGSLPFARSISDTQSEFRLLSKLTELLMKHGDRDEALQYATLAVQVAGKTGTGRSSVEGAGELRAT